MNETLEMRQEGLCQPPPARRCVHGVFKYGKCAECAAKTADNSVPRLELTCPVHGEYEVTPKQKTCPTCLTQAALYRQIEPDGVEGVRPKDEFDPTGAEAHEPGAKLDGGKTLAGVLSDFSLALQAVAEVGTHGARKYSRGGWQSVPDALTRYKDAEWRHLLKSRHEEYDPDSGLLHDAHKAWNVLAQLELRLRGDAIDWKTYPASVTVDLDKLEAHNKAVVEEAREIQRRNK